MKTKRMTDFGYWLESNGLTIQSFSAKVGMSFGAVAKLSSDETKKVSKLGERAIAAIYPECPLITK